MRGKVIPFFTSALIAGLLTSVAGFSAPPTPSAQCAGEWDAEGGFHERGEHYQTTSGGQLYNCVACGGCKPAGGGGGGGGSSGMSGGLPTSEEFAQQMMMGIIGNLIQQAFAPPPDNSAYLEQQAALEKAKKEAEQRERMARWQQLEQLRADQQDKENSQLRSMLDVPSLDEPAGGGAFDVMDWGDRADELPARGTGRHDTSSLSLVQRLACANDLAQRAQQASEKGDYVNARYLNEQAQNAMSGLPTELECRYDDAPAMPQSASAVTPEMASYQDIIGQVQRDVQRLQDIKFRRVEIEQEKQAAITQIDKARDDIITIKNKPSADDDSLLLEAEQLLAQAENDLAALEADEQHLAQQQTEIENSLKAVQEQFQPGATDQ